MSVAAPVLEREVSVRENTVSESGFERSVFSADERHNAQIGSVYARLINPECTIEDVIGEHASNYSAEKAEEIPAPAPYLVTNARADSDLFRADSPVNRIQAEPVRAEEADSEEENEDLRPTQTTIQYKTAGVVKTEEHGKIENAGAVKSRLSKKEKVTIAIVVAVIVALFVLIIVNSAIITNLNSDLSLLQSSLATAKASYSGVSDEVTEYLNNIGSAVENYAYGNGMTGN